MANRNVVLAIGGTAKVGGAVVEPLKQADVPVLAASRSERGPSGVTRAAMDWFDSATYVGPSRQQVRRLSRPPASRRRRRS